MNTLKNILILLVFIGCYQSTTAQSFNFKAMEIANHIAHVGMGWDHGLSYSAGYAYKINQESPLYLNVNFSIPSGEILLDDYKAKLGGQMVVSNNPNLKGSVGLNGVIRRFESPLTRLFNVGAELKGSFGYYKPKWFVASEMGFDKAIVTHFKHSNMYRETVYADVKDGWFKPTTGGHINYGIQAGYSLKNQFISLSIGRVMTQDFKTAPLIPYYMMLGVSYGFGEWRP